MRLQRLSVTLTSVTLSTKTNALITFTALLCLYCKQFRAESKLVLKGEDCGTVYNIFLYFFILIKKCVKIILLNKMCDNHKLLFSTDLISWKMFGRKIPLTFCQRNQVDAQKKTTTWAGTDSKASEHPFYI